MKNRDVELVVPHPETGEEIEVDGSTFEYGGCDGDFSDVLE